MACDEASRINTLEVKIAQLQGLAKAHVDIIRELVERVEKLEENRHDPRQAFLDDAISQYKERPFNPMPKPPNCS